MAQAPVLEFRREQGWETTSHDYNLHVSRIEKMPSVLPDVPRYPSVYRLFNNRVVSEEQPEVPKKQNSPPKPAKNVQLSDKLQILGQDCYSGEDNNIDEVTDGFLQKKRKGFQLCQWKTFK